MSSCERKVIFQLVIGISILFILACVTILVNVMLGA
jgi:hypothetical protein